MNIEKIEINGHYVWVDKDADINENDFILTKDNRVIEVSYLLSKDLEQASKIIAASPELSLKGVPTYVEWLAVKEYTVNDSTVGLSVGGDMKRGAFIRGYQTAEKELQKQLITEIMNEDAKYGLYEPLPTWDDVRKAIEMAREEIIRYRDNGWGVSEAHKLGYKMKEEEIIEQIKQSKQSKQ